MSIVVNMFAGPGAGKSTTTAGVFAELKMRGVNAEIASEFAKDLVWEERFGTLNNQIYVFGKQLHRIQRLVNKVDVIITDSPLLFSVLYKPENLSDNFEKLVLEVFNSFDNTNYLIQRVKPYNSKGRVQTEAEAREKDNEAEVLLQRFELPYMPVPGNRMGIEIIAKDALMKLNGVTNE